MKKKYIVLLVTVMTISILGISYAWFNYRGETGNKKLIGGSIYLTLIDGNDSINLENAYPMTKEEARARTDNYTIFSLKGKNTTDENIYYEILLNYGDSIANKNRYNDRDLMFDLIEVGSNNEETYLLDAVSYDTINNRKIWIDTVRGGTENEIEKIYKLRIWLSDKVIISDTDSNATYNATGENAFKNYYGSVKVGVYGDLNEKSLPSSTTTRDSFVENGKSYFMTYLTNDYLLEEEGELLDENDIVILEITNPENKIYFSYVDSKGNEDTSQNGSLTLTYTYNRNETVNIKVFTESRNDSNVNTTLHFKVTKNGNIVQEYNKEIFVLGNNYCLNNGFTKLSDCILVTENLSNTVNNAKAFINSKGSPNVNVTAPTYEYVEQITENKTYTGTSGYPNWSSGEKYVFDSTTGTFDLKEADGTTNASTYVPLSNDLVGKYTCGTQNGGYSNCSSVYKVTSVDTENGKITGTKITYKMNSSMDSQIGLYKVIDNDGDSYIYRGAVSNNNVYFGGYYWKIIRINGDGSIRLIFNGSTLSSNGNKYAGNSVSISSNNGVEIGSTYPFNSNSGGPTYVGYMNTESDNYWTTSSLATYSGFVEDTTYYFADDFETYTDSYGNRQFKLKGNVYQSKFKDLTAAQIEARPYTCSGTSDDLICNRLLKVYSRTDNVTIRAYYVTYSPNYEANPSLTNADVEMNVQDSTAKAQLELWYQNIFSTKLNNGNTVVSYIIDSPFCSDRTISNIYTYGDYTLSLSNSNTSGYLLTSHSYYQKRRSLIDAVEPNRSATLLCSKNDNFSVTETNNKNGKLNYPVGLITVDEVALAGGKYYEKNGNYWLKTNGTFWTMSPAYYTSSYAYARVFDVTNNGSLYSSHVDADYGLRAVINLKSDTLISSGDGSATNPYIIE